MSPVGEHTLQELNTLYLTRFRTYKIARPPQTKTQEGRGLQTYCKRLSPYRSIFVDDDISLWCQFSRVVDPYSFFPDPDPDPEFDVGDQHGSRALMTKN